MTDKRGRSTVLMRLMAVGLVLIALGLIFGFTPNIPAGGEGCTAAFTAGPAESAAYDLADRVVCANARGSDAVKAWILLVSGGLVLVGAWVGAGVAHRDTSEAEASGED